MKLLLLGLLTAGLGFSQIIGTSPTTTLNYDLATSNTVSFVLTVNNSGGSGVFYTWNSSYISALIPSLNATVNPPSGYLSPGGSVPLTVTLNAAALTTGTYTVPVVINATTSLSGSGSTSTVSYGLSLIVIDSRNYNPDANAVVPDIVSGGGWKTVITLLNPSAAASLVNVKFYDITGTPMAVTVEGQKTSQFPALVSANGVATLTLSEPSGTITSGTIEFSTVYGTAPKAFVTYDNSNFQAIIPAAVPNVSSFSLGFNETGNSRTGLALGNYLNFTQVINLQFYDSLGNYIETQMLTLPPYGSTSIILQNMDPALAGKTGLVKVSALHSGISGFGINLNVAKGYFVTSPEF